MTTELSAANTHDIVIDDLFPHSPEVIWRALASGDMMARWIMPPTGFAPVAGTQFTFQTRPAGAWDGIIHCEVLDVVPHERLAYSWRGGHDDNVGYGARLDTIVTWNLKREGTSTRLRLVHAGFVLPRNASALGTMGEGWKNVIPKLRALTDK